jgi:ribosomal protein S18 acetylase RimI-like enzyme
MTDLVGRIHAFERELERRCAQTIRPGPFGTAFLNEDFPSRYDSNFLWVEVPLAGVSAEELIAEMDRVLGAAGLDHRECYVDDDVEGERLARRLRELGWWVDHLVLLARVRDPDRPSAVTVRRVDFDEARPLIEEIVRRQPYATDEDVVRQLVQHRGLLEEVAAARFFVAEARGRPAAICELYVIDSVAQIEDVNTLSEFRGRGLARAVVLAAADHAAELGCDLVFVIADDEDWPKGLYRRLGFEAVGRFWSFVRPAPEDR